MAGNRPIGGRSTFPNRPERREGSRKKKRRGGGTPHALFDTCFLLAIMHNVCLYYLILNIYLCEFSHFIEHDKYSFIHSHRYIRKRKHLIHSQKYIYTTHCSFVQNIYKKNKKKTVKEGGTPSAPAASC